MKKVILSCTMMLFLMSFTNKDPLTVEEIFSPECFEFAENATNNHFCGFSSYEDEYNYWVTQYDDCEGVTNFDEFQFP